MTLLYFKEIRVTGRKGVVWSGIWGVDIIPRYDMVLRPYHLIFMGWSGKFAGIIPWYGKFLVYVGVSHIICRNMGNILYIE